MNQQEVQQDGRLPPVYFRPPPPNFVKNENILFSEIFFLHKFFYISNIQNFLIFLFKKLHNSGGKGILPNIIWYAIYSKFATFDDVEKIQSYPQKNIYFFKKPSLVQIWKLLQFQSHFTASFVYFGLKNSTSESYIRNVFNRQEKKCTSLSRFLSQKAGGSAMLLRACGK